jgi:hypothetical protein
VALVLDAENCLDRLYGGCYPGEPNPWPWGVYLYLHKSPFKGSFLKEARLQLCAYVQESSRLANEGA